MFATRRDMAAACWVAMLLICAGCGETQQTSDAGAGHCPGGLRAVGKACAPIFDSCKDDEIPLLGGGCKKVGVEQCEGGIKGPPDWKCTPIGIPTPCKPGWQRHADGYCEPILPAAACPAGTMEVIGKRDCQPIGGCGSGTWGKIVGTYNTLFVDGAYTGGKSDGARARPFTTISAALAKVSTGGHIAVAAGTYNEDLRINAEGVTLEGRCASMVTLKGQAGDAAVLVTKAGVTVRGLTVTGPKGGIWITHVGKKSFIEQVAVQNKGPIGIMTYDSVMVRDSLIKGVKEAGVWVYNTAVGSHALMATLERVVVRDTTADATNPHRGYGVVAWPGATVTIRDSLLTNNQAVGILGSSSTVVAVRSFVTATRPRQSDGNGGAGIAIYLDTSFSTKPQVTLRDCLLRDNMTVGVMADDGVLTIEGTAVVATKPSPVNGKVGYGIQVSRILGSAVPVKLTLRDSLVADNAEYGVHLRNPEAIIERSVVRDTRPWPTSLTDYEKTGAGIQIEINSKIQHPSKLTVKDSLVSGNHSQGIMVIDSTATLERVVIRDTKPVPPKGWWGEAVNTAIKHGVQRPVVTLRDCLVTGNQGFSLGFQDAIARVERSVVRDTRVWSHPESSMGIGINTSTYAAKQQATLDVVQSVLSNHAPAAIFASGSRVTVSQSVLRDNEPDTCAGVIKHWGGFGLVSGRLIGKDKWSNRVEVKECVFLGNTHAGLQLESTSATLERTLVRQTRAADGRYGDGVVVIESSTANIKDCELDQNARAGILFWDSSGTVSRSLVRRGAMPVALWGATNPKLAADNEFRDNKDNKVSTGQLLSVHKMPKIPVPGRD